MYDIEMFRFKYVGICAGIKVLSLLISSFDWWLIRRKELEENGREGEGGQERIEMYENSSCEKEDGYLSVAQESPTHQACSPGP